MPEYLTEADLIQTPQQDFLTEADLVAPVAKVAGKPKKKKKKKPAEPVYLGEWQQEAESLAKQHESTRQVIKAVEDIAKRAKPFQGGLASGAQTETPVIVTPMRRGYKRVQRGAKKEIIAPTGLPVTEGTYAKDAYSRHPEVASMRASSPAEAAQLEEIARLSQPGFRTALDRGMLQSNQTLKNFGAGMLGLVDDLGKAIHPTNFVGEATEENLVHTLARKLTESSQEDAATLAAIDKNYGSPAEKIAEIGRGLPGMIGSVYLSTQMTGNPALGFAVQKMADARGRGITDPGELATQGILGLAEGALFNKMNQMQMGPGRILAQGAAGAAQVPLEYRIGATAEQLEKKPLPDFGDVVEGALTNVGLDIVMPGGRVDPKSKADEALQALPEPDRKAVQFAMLSPDPNSFRGLTPKQREAALLNWHMEAHPVFKDETGNPKIFYHGTKVGEIDFFDTQSDGNIGSHFGSIHAANSFANSKEEGTVVYPVYLNIKNPAITSDLYPIGVRPESLKAALLDVKTLEGDSVFSEEEINDWVGKMRTSEFRVQRAGDQIFKAALEAKGFDGIQYENEVEDPGHISTIAFYPYQVKSVWAKEFNPGSTKLEFAQYPVSGFTLKSVEALDNPKVPEKMTPDQAAAALKGVKAEELEWLGLNAAIEKARQEGRQVTKAELRQTIENNQVELRERALLIGDRPAGWNVQGTTESYKTIWGDTYVIKPGVNGWQLRLLTGQEDILIGEYPSPGEARLDVPDSKDVSAMPQYTKLNPWNVKVSNPREILFEVHQGGKNIAEGYIAPHFNEKGKGLMAHARVWDGQVEGKRSLMLGEVQSDLHQQGKARGYGESGSTNVERLARLAELADLREEGLMTEELSMEEDRLNNELLEGTETGPIPNTPFKETWPELILKRMVKYAAEKGYDQIVWPPASAHAELYYGGMLEKAPKLYSLIYDQKLPKLAKDFAKKFGATYKFTSSGHILEMSPKLREVASEGKLPLFAMNKGMGSGEQRDKGAKSSAEKGTSFRFTQPAARFYEGRDQRGGTVYVNPQMAAKLADWPATAGAVNVETKEFGRMLARLDKNDPQAKVLEEAFVEAINKDQPSVNVVIYSEGTGMWARRLARHEGFHRGQYLASREALKAKGQEGLFQPDIGTIHDPAMHDHPVVQRVANSPIGESIKSRYEESYAPAALTFETAAYMASSDFRRFGVSADEAALFVKDYLKSVANKSGVKGLQALVDGTRLIPSIEQAAKEIINGRTEQTIRTGRGSADVSGRLGGTVGEFAESGAVGGGDRGDGGGGVSETTGAEPPNIYTTVLSSDAVKQIAKKAGDVLKVLGIPENPLLPPHEQIMRALKDHPDKATPEAIGAAMRQLGLDGKDLVEAVDEASKHAGQLLRNLQDANAKWTKTIKDDPKWATEAAKTGAHILGLGPSPKEVLKEGLASLEASELGRTWWQRSGNLYRKMLLSRFSTAAVNSITTTFRLPLDLIDGAMTGAAMGALNPKKYAGKSDASIAEAAKEGAIAGAQATMRVAMAFPEMAKKLLRKPTPKMDTNDLITSQMENLHPELHTKLTGLSTGLDVIKESKAKIEDLKSLLPYLNDSEKQKEYEARLNLLQKRYDANNSMLGKAFNKTGWVYDQFIKPSTLQEFFFRRPYFVGALVKRAKDAGYDLYSLIENTKRIEDFSKDPTGQDVNEVLNLRTLADLPPEVWEGAADDALTFTYAYAPKKDRGVVENLYATWIQSMQKLGLAGAIIDAFPKATYNGLKFAYEYSPLGMLKPALNIAGDVREGGREAVKADDVSRMVKGGLGMAMFATALYIRREHGGEEWYQIKTGKKDKKGQPIYMNVKKYMPFAGMLYLADVANRAWEGRLFEVKTHADDIAELYLNARRADSGGAAFFDLTKEMLDWVDTGAPVKDKTKAAAARPLANILGAPLTPLVNLRDMVAQFDEDEAARRDQKGAPILGPAIDKIPWLRSSEKYGLPLTQPPTEQAPRPFSAAPGLTWFGVNLDPGSNFATREFARLGLSPIRWLKPDPDPVINRAQYAAYSKKLAAIAPKIEASPLYQKKTDAQKAAFWEAKLAGPDGIAAEARELGKQANPKEINKREILQSQPPLMRKATGLDKKVNAVKNASDKK